MYDPYRRCATQKVCTRTATAAVGFGFSTFPSQLATEGLLDRILRLVEDLRREVKELRDAKK